MKIKQITLFPLTLKLKKPFVTSQGTTLKRPITLIEIELLSGITGYGEIQAFADANYAPQTQELAIEELKHVLPNLIGLSFNHPMDLKENLNQATSFAKASIDMALWDAYGKTTKCSLAQLIGHQLIQDEKVPVGTVIGIQSDHYKENQKIKEANLQGYKKIKFKTEDKSTSLELVKLANQITPQTITTIDANQAWINNLATLNYLKELENQGLKLIEEPLKNATLTDYSTLQANFENLLISLDESLSDLNSIKRALEINSSQAFTIKQGKIGGISDAISAIDLIFKHDKIPWIGGMLTSGLGRSVDLALTAYLKNNLIPADISASSHYFERDFVNETIKVDNGQVKIPQTPGIGVTINWEAVNNLQTSPKIQFK